MYIKSSLAFLVTMSNLDTSQDNKKLLPPLKTSDMIKENSQYYICSLDLAWHGNLLRWNALLLRQGDNLQIIVEHSTPHFPISPDILC